MIYRFLPKGIQARLLLLISVMLLPFFLLMGWRYYHQYQILHDQALNTELEVAYGIANTFAAYIDDLHQLNYTVGQALITLTPTASDHQDDRLLVAASFPFKVVRNMHWVDPGGTILASTDPKVVGHNLSERLYYQQIIAGAAWALGPMTPTGLAVDLPTFAIASAIRAEAGDLRGLVVSAIEPALLGQVIFSHQRPAGGAYAIFDLAGTVVYRSPEIPLSWQERVAWKDSDQLLRASLQTGTVQTGDTSLVVPGGRWVSARVPIGNLGWVAGAGRPQPTVWALVRGGILPDASISLLIALSFLFLAALLARNIGGSLQRLERETREIDHGRLPAREDHSAPLEVRRLRATLADISQALVWRADALRESEEALRTIFDSTYDGLLIHEVDGTVIDANRTWLNMFQISVEEARRLNVADISGSGMPMESAPDLWRKVIGGEPQLFEWRSKRPKTGEEFDVEVYLRSIPRQNRQVILSHMRDISERKMGEKMLMAAKEAAEAANRAKSDFLSNVSHELRTPMTVILGYLEFMMDKVPPEQRPFLETVDTASQQLLCLIDDLLDISRIEARRMRLFERPFDPRECVREAVELFTIQAREKGLHIRSEIDPQVAEMVCGDPDRIMQILVNLIGNAVKFTKSGEVAVAVTAIEQGVVFSVADTGIGIPETALCRIFTPFEQVDSSSTRPYGGTGLGLALSRELVELMGGEIWVESEVDRGSRFSFRLPLPPAPPPLLAPLSTVSTPQAATASRILVAEDDPLIREMIVFFLQQHGWRAEVAETGAEALTKWEQGGIDLILMDVQMPGMDGLEATGRIRELEKERGIHTWVIGLTAHAGQGYREQCLAAGMDNYLAKPIHQSELFSLIDHYFKKGNRKKHQ
jgi:PAS domain S-box-containing protein